MAWPPVSPTSDGCSQAAATRVVAMAKVRSNLLLVYCVDLLIFRCLLCAGWFGRSYMSSLDPGVRPPSCLSRNQGHVFRTCSIGGSNGARWNTVGCAVRSTAIVPQSAQLFLGYFAYVNPSNFL